MYIRVWWVGRIEVSVVYVQGLCGPRRTTATWFYLLQPSDRALRNEEFLEWRWQPEVYVSTDHLGGRP